MSNEVQNIYLPASATHQFELFELFRDSKIPLYFPLQENFPYSCVCGLRFGKELDFYIHAVKHRLGSEIAEGLAKISHPRQQVCQVEYCRYLSCGDAPTHRTCHEALPQYWKTNNYVYSPKTPCMEIPATKDCFQYYRTGEIKNPWDEDLKLNPETPASSTQQGGNTQVWMSHGFDFNKWYTD